jgi:cation diffusion facilitator family transporter
VRVFALGVLLNLGIVVLEAVYGVVAHSMALLSDAGHNLGDVLGLVLAGGATFLARRRPTKRRTYGYRRLTLLSALANGIFLLVAVGAIAGESIRRFGAPRSVAEHAVIWVAAIAAVGQRRFGSRFRARQQPRRQRQGRLSPPGRRRGHLHRRRRRGSGHAPHRVALDRPCARASRGRPHPGEHLVARSPVA